MDVSLVLVQQDRRQREVPLKRQSVILGRDGSCQIRIAADAVSRRHCEITSDGDSLQIKDLGSSNGTFVNRRRITHADLAPGDVIGVGAVVLVVRIDGKPQTIDSETALSMISSSAPAPAQPVAKPAATTAKPAPGKPSSLLDDDEDDAAPSSKDDMEDSSLSDFDFFDDDDEKGQPKL